MGFNSYWLLIFLKILCYYPNYREKGIFFKEKERMEIEQSFMRTSTFCIKVSGNFLRVVIKKFKLYKI